MTLAGLPYAGEKSKPHDYKQKDKNEGPSEIMGFNGKTVWRLQTKKRTETLMSTFQKNPVELTAPKYINWIWPL